MYALPHKKERIKRLAKMMGYSVSALLNHAFDFFHESKKDELRNWIEENTPKDTI